MVLALIENKFKKFKLNAVPSNISFEFEVRSEKVQNYLWLLLFQFFSVHELGAVKSLPLDQIHKFAKRVLCRAVDVFDRVVHFQPIYVVFAWLSVHRVLA